MKRKAFEDDWAVRDYAVKKLKLLVPLEYFVSEIQIPLTNLIREMLHINPNARPNALELHEVFTNLLNALPISTLESEITLFSKIFRLVSDDVESHEDQHTVYVKTLFLLTWQVGYSSFECLKAKGSFKWSGYIRILRLLRTQSIFHWSR